MYVTKPTSKIEVLVAERLASDPFLNVWASYVD